MAARITFMIAAGAAAARAAITDGDIGVDHMYNDISNFNMTTNTTVECYNACVAEPSCMGWVFIPQTTCASPYAICYLKAAFGPAVANTCRVSGIVPSRAVAPKMFDAPLVGSVHPTGWLARQLAIQAAGLSGHLALFWPDVQTSTWIGGGADGGLHERTPYWLNGIVPLALQTGDVNMTAQMNTYVDYILGAQQPSGWLGPDDMPTSGDQYWSRYNIVQMLLQLWEATKDARIVPALFAYFAEARRRMANVQLGDWAAVRGQDLILSLERMIDLWPQLNGVPPGVGPAFLYDFAVEVHSQMLLNGGDWKTWYDDEQTFPKNVTCKPSPCSLLTHGVNNGQAIKSEAVWFRMSWDDTDVASTYIRMDKLDEYHGAPSGIFQADEHLAGNMPSHGTELCAVVEASFSYAIAGEVIGDARFFERAEQITYNALPATLTKDMWAHQYLQQANEISAAHTDPHIWVTDGPDSTILGLEPNYGCCTANYHQGWPKTAQRLVQSIVTGGVAIAMYGPTTASVALTTGGTANVSVVTDYPFGDNATVTIAAPSGTPFMMRVPSWAQGATLSVNGGAAINIGTAAGSWYNLTLTTGSTSLFIDFAPQIMVETGWYNGAVAVRRGALLYSLQMGENITVLNSYAFQSKDYQVVPTTAWNYALVVDPANPGASLTFTQVSGPGAVPYAEATPPVKITGQARAVNAWTEQVNAAGAPPNSPVDCSAAGACGPATPITLVPFGSTLLRMAELPYTSA